MDANAIAGMIFALVLIAMIGGFILLFPITRRLGALLEQRIQGRATDERSPADNRRMEAAIASLQEELRQLAERQAFTESLLSRRDPLLLPEDRQGT